MVQNNHLIFKYHVTTSDKEPFSEITGDSQKCLYQTQLFCNTLVISALIKLKKRKELVQSKTQSAADAISSSVAPWQT